jgi:hypothetical protein
MYHIFKPNTRTADTVLWSLLVALLFRSSSSSSNSKNLNDRLGLLCLCKTPRLRLLILLVVQAGFV